MKQQLQPLFRMLRELLLFCIAGLLPGALLGVPLQGLGVGVGTWLLWNLVQPLRLWQWLQRETTSPPPRSLGLWQSIFTSLGRRQAEQAASAEAVAPLRELFQNFNSAVILLDADGRIAWCNQAATSLLGVRFPEDRRRHLGNLLRTPELLHFLQQMPEQTPLECASPGDASRHLRFGCARLPEGRGIVFVQDITQPHRLEKMRRDFIANVSHELRTPLTVIIGSLELMDEPLPPAKLREMQEDMRHQAGRMSDLVQSLLRLAQLESMTEPAAREHIPLRLLLAEVCDSMKAKAGEGRRLESHCPDALVLLGSRGELQSVFLNLLDNAVRHTDAREGVVQVEAEGSAEGIRVKVKDNGAGIERRHLPRLTERFYRVDEGRNSAQAGTGLGLAIVKHALERHQGELQIHSRPGEGSEFVCCFPPERSG